MHHHKLTKSSTVDNPHENTHQSSHWRRDQYHIVSIMQFSTKYDNPILHLSISLFNIFSKITLL
jgi:hypothetical protein